MLYIRHRDYINSKGETVHYDFVQPARCKHCLWCYLKPSPFGSSFTYTCSHSRKFVNPDFLCCSNYVCNEKYELFKSSVQLKLF